MAQVKPIQGKPIVQSDIIWKAARTTIPTFVPHKEYADTLERVTESLMDYCKQHRIQPAYIARIVEDSSCYDEFVTSGKILASRKIKRNIENIINNILFVTSFVD
jgi:hypothetical protein